MQWSIGLPWLQWSGNALARIHSPGIDIEVRIDLDRRHLQALRFQQQARGGGCKRTRRVSKYHVASSVRTTYDALRVLVKHRKASNSGRYEIHTFPTPLITPPETSTYFMIACGGSVAVGEGEREKSLTAVEGKLYLGRGLAGLKALV